MNINPDLVEKITRMVLSKLNEHSESLPLSEEEMKRWNEISPLINPVYATAPPMDKWLNLTPLSEEEIKLWEKIGSSFSIRNNANNDSSENILEQGKVRFHRTF